MWLGLLTCVVGIATVVLPFVARARRASVWLARGVAVLLGWWIALIWAPPMSAGDDDVATRTAMGTAVLLLAMLALVVAFLALGAVLTAAERTRKVGAQYLLSVLLVPAMAVGGTYLCRSVIPEWKVETVPEPRRPHVAAVEGWVRGAERFRLYYRRVIDGDRVVIVVHGGPGLNFEDGGPDLEPLGSGRTLLMYDQRGGGRSDPVPNASWLSIAEHVRDLEEVRREFGIRRFSLVALSYGAAIALDYAVQHPDRVDRLVLVSPMPVARTPFLEQRGRAFLAAIGTDRAARLREIVTRFPGASDTDVASYCHELNAIELHADLVDARAQGLVRGDPCRFPPAVLRAQWRNGLDMMQWLGEWDYRGALATLAVPMLVIEGEETTVPLDGTRAWIVQPARQKLFLVPAAGHMPFVEQPAAFFAAARAFLDGA